jgi:aspartate racemase
MFNNTLAKRDQDHVNAVLVSCPSLITDRTKFLLGEESESPVSGLFESAKILHQSGATYAVVVCNTAHSDRIYQPLCDRVANELPGLTMVNMLATCADWVRHNLAARKIGLLATMGTYTSRVYREYFPESEGFELMEPEQRGKERVMDAIYSLDYGIKAHSDPVMARACNILLYEGFRLAEHGAEALVLGCTELPLAVKASDFPIPVLDPGLLAARELIRLADPEKLRPLS